MKLIVGLGNYSDEYMQTRHNIGFIFLDYYLKNPNYNLDKKNKCILYKTGENVFVKPTTFMNLSGDCISKLILYYKISISNLLVIHDDIDQKVGNFKFIQKGGSGGHNGIKDIIEKLGTNEFKRIKIGVAPEIYNPSMHKATDFVLKNFSKEELQNMYTVFDTEIVRIVDGFVENK